MEISQRELDAELWKNGICECKAAGKWKYKQVGRRYILICVRCGRPKYWPNQYPQNR